MRQRQQSTSTYVLPIVMRLSSDHNTLATGKTVTVRLSKNGLASVAASGAISEVDSVNTPGQYIVAGNATDTSALGPMTLYATAPGCDPFIDEYNIVAYNPFDATRLGLSALPNASAGANGGLPTADASNQVKANVTAITAGIIAAASFASGALDAVWSTAARTLTAFGFSVTVGTNNDKTGYALTSGEHTLISGTDVPAGMVIQGYSTTRAGYLDTLSGLVAAIWASATRTLTAFGFSVTVDTNNDKTGYALTTGEHTLISGTDVPNALTAQGYTTVRAGYLDTLNGLVTAVWGAATRTLTAFGFGVTVSTNTDKTGYTLTSGEHTTISGTDIPAGLIAQGYTTTRAGYLDVLNGIVAAVQSGLATIGNQITINSNVLAVPAAVWAYVTRTLTSASGPTVQQIVNGIWDESNALHVIPGSTGLNLSNASRSSSPQDIADAVWDEINDDHLLTGSTGEVLSRISIANGILIRPVSPNQESISLVYGDTYVPGHNPIIFTWEEGGLTDPNIVAYYIGTASSGGPAKIDAVIIDDFNLRIDLPITDGVPQSTLLKEGHFAVRYTDGTNKRTIALGAQHVTIPIGD